MGLRMTPEQLIIALIRVLGSLPVLKWAFIGAIIAIVVDFSDLFWMSVINLGGVQDYQTFDKFLDLGYMVAFLYVSFRWTNLDRNIAIGLFIFRMIGLIAFEFTGERMFLFYFPNVFEFWFIFVAGRKRFFPSKEGHISGAYIALPACLLAKLGQEWIIHGAKYLDQFTFFEAVEAIYSLLVFWV